MFKFILAAALSAPDIMAKVLDVLGIADLSSRRA